MKKVVFSKLALLICATIFIAVVIGASAYYNKAASFVEETGGQSFKSKDVLKPADKKSEPSLVTETSLDSDARYNPKDSNEKYIEITRENERFNVQQEVYGYFDVNSLRQYSTYSNQDLRQLGKSGDLRALQVLAMQARAGGDTEVALNYLDIASAYGSTYALTESASINEKKYLENMSSDEGKASLIEAFALLEVAKIRGDLYGSTSKQRALWRKVENVNDVDQVVISERSKQIYSQMGDRRKEWGLDSFDNSVNPVSRELAGYYEKEIEKLKAGKSTQ